MNPIQQVISKVAGIDGILDAREQEYRTEQLEIAETLEQLVADNHLLQRQIEDLDYLNLYELNAVQEIMPSINRKQTLNRLRRLRHDNPLAKQAVKLIIRFTLGRGIQWILAPEKDATDEFKGPGILDDSVTVRLTNSGQNSSSPSSNGSSPKPPPPQFKKGQSEAIAPSDDPIFKILRSFYNDPDNRLVFTTHKALQTWLDELVTDGEKFYACFEGHAEPYVRATEVPCEEIVQIIYDPDNRVKPVYYKRQWMPLQYDGQSDTYKPNGVMQTKYYLDYRIDDNADLKDIQKRIHIPKSKIAMDGSDYVRMRHEMINEIWTKNGKRGLSELFASREWFKVFREFMEGRASINAAAQAISYIRKVKGGPTAVAGMKNSFGGMTVGDTADASEIGKLTRPVRGSVYNENQAVDLDWMKADTGAVNAKEDARLLLMSAGAGVSTMAHYFGEGGDANLATAQSMELPMVKTYEDYQQITDNFLRGWFRYVLEVALRGGDEEQVDEDVEDAVERIVITFPAIIAQDVVKYTTAWAQLIRDIAPNNPTLKILAVRSSLSALGTQNINAIMPGVEADLREAEIQRQAQMMSLLNPPDPMADPNDPNGPGKPPPVAGKVPNAGFAPRDKALANGKVPESNGPKPV